MTRPSWDEYFLKAAQLAASRSTCLTASVGAVVVRDRQILATGYNGPPPTLSHCSDRGFCYPELKQCGKGSDLPSRAIHAEVNAIAQAAKHGISTNGATVYVTHEPCLNCLKLLIAAGIKEVVYSGQKWEPDNPVKKEFFDSSLVNLRTVTGALDSER